MTRSIITVLQPWQRRRYDLKKDEFLIEFSKIIKVPVDQITENEALGTTPSWDSFAHVEILILLEKEFEIEIDENTLNWYISLNRILKLLN